MHLSAQPGDPAAPRALTALAALALGAGACFVSFDGYRQRGEGGGGAGGASTSTTTSSGSSTTTTSGSCAGSLDPKLSLPSPSGAACVQPGDACPAGQICHPSSPCAGRCEACVACKGFGEACTSNADCHADAYLCYEGKCAVFCDLAGKLIHCSTGYTCLDVGHESWGVCWK